MMRSTLVLAAVSAAAAAGSCNDFKMKCQTTCIAKSGGVSTGQCWGTPTYRFCKCSDASVVTIPGYTCDHPTCPAEARGSTEAPRYAPPAVPAPTPTPVPSALCSFCGTSPAVSGFTTWVAGTSPDSSTVRTLNGGGVVVCAESHHYAYAEFALEKAGSSYATIDVPLKNRAEAWDVVPKDNSADIEAATGLAITYQSTVDTYLQVRHGANKHGGHHYRVLLPAHASMATANFAFGAFAQPSWTNDKYALNLKDVFSFTFVATESGSLLVQSMDLGTPSGATLTPLAAGCAASKRSACSLVCAARRPSLAGAPAPTPAATAAPETVSTGSSAAYVAKAAAEAVRLRNVQLGLSSYWTLVRIVSGSENRVQGYSYRLQLVVASPTGEQKTVEAVVATTTYRDIFNLFKWDEGAVVAATTAAPTKVQVNPTPAPTYNNNNNNNGGNGNAVANSGNSGAGFASAGGVTGPSVGTVITPQGDARRIYNAPYKARGALFPFITEDGECVDIAQTNGKWPAGYMPCCPGCHSRPCSNCGGN
jgi:hypothetical protein